MSKFGTKKTWASGNYRLPRMIAIGLLGVIAGVYAVVIQPVACSDAVSGDHVVQVCSPVAVTSIASVWVLLAIALLLLPDLSEVGLGSILTLKRRVAEGEAKVADLERALTQVMMRVETESTTTSGAESASSAAASNSLVVSITRELLDEVRPGENGSQDLTPDGTASEKASHAVRVEAQRELLAGAASRWTLVVGAVSGYRGTLPASLQERSIHLLGAPWYQDVALLATIDGPGNPPTGDEVRSLDRTAFDPRLFRGLRADYLVAVGPPGKTPTWAFAVAVEVPPDTVPSLTEAGAVAPLAGFWDLVSNSDSAPWRTSFEPMAVGSGSSEAAVEVWREVAEDRAVYLYPEGFQFGDRVLGRGSVGPDVGRLQVALSQLGFDVGRVDDRHGPKTEQALGEFQVAVGLEPTMRFDAETAAALRRLRMALRSTPAEADQGTLRVGR